MSNALVVLMIGAAIVVAILLVRLLKRHDPRGYQRRFDNPANRHDAPFPFASTLYVGDGGSGSHLHHPHSADCAHTSDAGGGCADGSGGS